MSFLPTFLRQRPGLVYLLIATPLWAIMVWGSFAAQLPTNWPAGDFWEHSAVLNTWMQALTNPPNSHLAGDIPSPRYMPFYLLIAGIGRLLSLTPFQAMSLAGALSATLFVFAVPMFFNRYLRNPWAASIALPVLLLGWGSSWLWSNIYQLRTLFYTISFPSIFVVGLSILTLGLLTSILRASSPDAGASRMANIWRLPLLAVLMALMLLSHPLTGAFAGMTLGLLALTEPDVAWRTRVWSLLFLAAGTAATTYWPWYPIWEVIFSHHLPDAAGMSITEQMLSQANRLLDQHPFYVPKQILFTFGPLLIGIPVLIWMALRRVHLFAAIGAAAMLLPYLLNIVVSVPLGHRFLLYVIFYCQFAVIWLLLRVLAPDAGAPAVNPRIRLLTAALFGLTVSWNLGLAVAEINGSHLSADGNYIPYHHPAAWQNNGDSALIKQYRSLASHLDKNAIVLARRRTGWPLPSFRGKVTALFHPNPLVTDRAARNQAIAVLFSEASSDDQRRAVVTAYSATHILFDRNEVSEPTLRFFDALRGERYQSGNLELIALRASH